MMLMKPKKLVVLIIFFFTAFFVRIDCTKSQNYDNFRYVDSMTYVLYSQQKWDSVIDISQKAIHYDIDYFYLRMRIAYSYFALNKYRMAIIHYKKALKFNSGDNVAMEMLYYSYLYSNRQADALALSARFSKTLAEKINAKSKLLAGVCVDAGYTFSNNKEKNNNIDFNSQSNIYGEADLNDDAYYLHIGMSHELGKFVNLYHGYNVVNVSKIEKAQVRQSKRSDMFALRQNEYYFSPEINIKRLVRISPSFHYMHDKYPFVQARFDTVLKRYVFDFSYRKFNNYALGLSISADYGNFQTGLNVSWSQLDQNFQYQFGLTEYYFPQSNTNLYFMASVQGLNLLRVSQFSQGTQSYYNLNVLKFIPSAAAGFRLKDNLWADVNATYVNSRNYSENNLLVIYNMSDKLLYMGGFSLIWLLKKNITFTFLYKFMAEQGNYIIYLTPFEYNFYKIYYQNHTISGGIKWNL